MEARKNVSERKNKQMEKIIFLNLDNMETSKRKILEEKMDLTRAGGRIVAGSRPCRGQGPVVSWAPQCRVVACARAPVRAVLRVLQPRHTVL